MYCHPDAVKKWAKAMKPKAPPRLEEQARVMREAKIKKREFLARQQPLFEVTV